MSDYIVDRVMREARYILDTKTTVRMCASVFSVSKSTVHTDITTRLKKIDFALYKEVALLLTYNMSVRHLRGGESTRKRYLSTDA